MLRYSVHFLVIMIAVAANCGCNSNSSSNSATDSNPVAQASSGPAEADNGKSEKPTTKRRTRAPVDIGSDSNSAQASTLSQSEKLNAVRDALKPFQILLGNWKALSQKTNAEQPSWAYDWVSDPKSPSLKLTSEKGVYVRDGWLSYLPDSDQFEFKATDAESVKRIFRGKFVEPVRDVAGDGKKLQRTYKLQLTEIEPSKSGEQWQMTFNQQENNRYILEIDRKRGNGPFIRVDTVHTQREGTSFALSETDYGDKTCIISQGLGTISVSYKGQSFWVCCSGCKSAFDEDPEKWIAKWEERKKSSGK